MLSDSDSDSNDLHTLTINKHFAKAFEYKKEQEELAKLDEKYDSEGSSDAGDSEDSEDTQEYSDGDELTPAVDAAIFCTLARIRKKDPAIYDGERRVFEGVSDVSWEEHVRRQDKAPVTKPKTKERSKPLTIRDAALASALADTDSHSPSPEPQPLTHTEEQALLRSETRAAFHGAIHSETQEDDDLLIPRSRTRDEIELEEEEYKAFLEREVGEDLHNLVTVDANEAIGASKDVDTVGDGEKSSGGKKKKNSKKELEKQNQETDGVQDKKLMKKRDKKSEQEANQDFLINYIFNRGWIDHSNKRVPTYNEIVESSSKRSRRRSEVDSDVDQNPDDDEREARGATISDEESFDDLADAFETSYNFRFEEPGGSVITSFPRNLSSARRESTIRKDARTRKKERLEAEKHILLEARRKEIRRARELVEAAVAEEDQDGLAFAHLDLDADWDPLKHDALMADLYGGDDADGGDAEKPLWDDEINTDDIVPPTNTKSKAELKRQKKKEKKNKNADEDVGVDVNEMDADLGAGADWGDEDDEEEEWRGTEEERKRKVDAYMDEVVNRLGFSGITSHMPTRFHYVPVASENYGLTPAEILLATDAELNSYVGLKKMAPYRVDKSGKAKKSWDPKRIEGLKQFRNDLHSRVGTRYEGSWSLDAATNTKNRSTEAHAETKKRKGKKERAKLKAMQSEKDEEADDGNETGIQPEVAGKPQKRKRDPEASSHSHAPLPGEIKGDVQDGARRKRRRRRHKKGSGGGGES